MTGGVGIATALMCCFGGILWWFLCTQYENLEKFHIYPIYFVFLGEDAIVYCIRGKEQGKVRRHEGIDDESYPHNISRNHRNSLDQLFTSKIIGNRNAGTDRSSYFNKNRACSNCQTHPVADSISTSCPASDLSPYGQEYVYREDEMPDRTSCGSSI